jgi:hypothetical protein
MSGAAVANALYPTIGTANPSANVDSMGVYTGFPASSALEKLAQRTDSTPCKGDQRSDTYILLLSNVISIVEVMQHKNVLWQDSCELTVNKDR